ncbi:uncharacterized protein LOC115882873 isoform X2 [Sitophilus oryzae]|uniref:Sterile alpha motif domain-containing protein 5 n=1 Tax=Sitophilus oryzae TaxID=7048 RepID=A0A6J2Y113_SITOR|nr:uncharacterized protein LOC115882873 isoform X2 [Sitophilus oryzae]
MTMASNIVTEWLKSLRLGQYSESFIDNGYDDLEICKQIGDPDLDAIGVFNPSHRARLLQSVRTLREEGAASVYFSLEEAEKANQEDDTNTIQNFLTSSANNSDVDRHSNSSKASGDKTVPSAPPPCTEEVAKYLDEYEEGKAELVKIPRMQLKVLLKEKLMQDGVKLSFQPYSTQDGERGYLEGLASRYADLFSTHYGDVLGHLEDLRKTEVAESATRERLQSNTSDTNSVGSNTSQGMTSSQSQPLYVPGKYLPSSCLTHKEEDEIYGFAGPVLKPNQIHLPQSQKIIAPPMTQPLLSHQQHNYQTCLSPRSAYFYEFPPNEQSYSNTSKKKNTFSRIQRIFKTSHRKEKHGSSSPRHGRAAARGVPQRVDTPDSVLQSGLGLSDLGQHAVLRSMVDPMDYDRLRHLQMNGGTPNSFEETIYKLKVQEALRKREKFAKEHEEILRDIKQGLLQLGKEGIRGPLTSADDTYMYDDDVRMLAPSCMPHPHDPRLGHWYDEPPYESDPEDFLMGGRGGPQATIQNGRVCFTLNVRPDQKSGEGVISLRTAGDISLPTAHCQTPRRGLILPREAGYPPTIIPLRSSRERESGDYASSDVQSVSSRLSTLSMDTSRSELLEMTSMISPQCYTQLDNNSKQRHFSRRSHNYPRSEDGLSPSQSSDYEDQEEYSNCSQQQIATVHVSSDGRTGVSSLVGKVRGLREDVQRKISRLKGDDQRTNHEQTHTFSASSVESLPSGSGSSTQALVRAGSNHSSISTEEVDPSPTDQIIGRARAVMDQIPSSYDKEALKFKAGDIIDIVSMNASGLWRGICHGKKGTFKFKHVELLSERSVKPKREPKSWHRAVKGKPVSVEDLLHKIGLPDYISVFVLNGYEDLELFKEIEPSDMDYLGIVNADHRAKILTAVQLLHELDSGSEGDIAGSSSENDDQRQHRTNFGRRHFPRDSGCYDGHKRSHMSPQSDTSDQADKNNLDSVVEQCNNEILARVRQAQKNHLNTKEDLGYEMNIPPMVLERKTKDSYVTMHGQTSLVDPCRRNLPSRKKTVEDFCETDQKFSSVKFVVGSELSEQGSLNILGKSCLSEKSSDSGVSSSSLSSTLKERDSRSMQFQHHLDRSNISANVTSTTANK